MKNMMKLIWLMVFVSNNIYALTIEDVKTKANAHGGTSLTFQECNLVGSKFSHYDSNGNQHTDKGFHCAYVSQEFNAREIAKIKNTYKNFNGDLEQLCDVIERKYNDGEAWVGSFNPETLECNAKSNIGQKEYDTMVPILKEQHYALVKKAQEASNNKRLAKQRKKEQRKAKWQARKGNTQPLSLGKSYTCELNPNMEGLLSMYGVSKFDLQLGKHSMEFGSINYSYKDNFSDFYLYRGYDSKNNQIIKAKVLKKKGIGDGYINLISNPLWQDSCHC